MASPLISTRPGHTSQVPFRPHLHLPSRHGRRGPEGTRGSGGGPVTSQKTPSLLTQLGLPTTALTSPPQTTNLDPSSSPVVTPSSTLVVDDSAADGRCWSVGREWCFYEPTPMGESPWTKAVCDVEEVTGPRTVNDRLSTTLPGKFRSNRRHGTTATPTVKLTPSVSDVSP